jgi:hypothetical protein
VPYRGIQRHTGGIVRLFSKRFLCLDQFDAVMSELHHHRFAVAAFRALERPLVMIWIVSPIDPRKKQRDAADKASTFSDWWNLGVHVVPAFLSQAGARRSLSVTGAWAEPLPMMKAGCAYSCRKSTFIGHR